MINDLAESKWTKRELLLLQKITNRINSDVGQDKVFKIIADGLRSLYNYDSVAIHLLSKDKKHLVVERYSADSKAVGKLEKLIGLSVSGYKVPLCEDSLLKEVVGTKKPVITDNITWVLKSYTDRKSLQTLIKPVAMLTKARWGMGVPLMAGDRVVGVIGCGSEEKLTDDDAQRLANFGAQAGLAVEKQQRYEMLEETVKERIADLKVANEKLQQEITERKQAEEELQLHSEIMENMVEGVYLVGLDDVIIRYANPKFEEMFGYSPGEMVGKHASIVNASTDKDPKETAREITGIIHKTGEWHGEVNNVKKDGTLFWCYANVSVFKHLHYGNVLVAVHTDITERKKVEEALQESEERLRTVIEASLDAIVAVNDQGVIELFNPAAEELFLYSPDEVLNKQVGILLHGDVAETHQKRLERFLNKGVGQCGHIGRRVERTFKRKDGTYFEAAIAMSGGCSNGKRLIVVSIHDITERKKAEEKIRESRIFIDNIIENAPDALITVDLKDTITSFSPGAEAMFGYKAEDMIGKSVLKLYPKRQRKKRKKWVEKLLKEGRLERFRTKQVKADGKTFDVSLSMALLKDAKDRSIGIVGISHDITEHLKADRELKKAYKDMKKLDRMKDEFLQNVSHELRTPITVMLTTIRVIKDTIKGERLKELLEINERSTWRLNRLVGDLLDFGRLDRGTMGLNLQPVDMRGLIRDAMADLHSYAEERQLNVELKLKKSLPWVVVDKDAIYRAVSNLLSNAIKFNKEGGRIEVEISAGDGFVKISVEDSGIGIDEKDLDKVFDRFFQVDGSTKRKYPGTGIGLALTKKLVEMHGGKIWVESKPGEWTRFTFTLPVGTGG